MAKDKEREDMSKEERKEAEEEEAKARQVFDPLKKVYDSRKRKATDLKECMRIKLPPPLSEKEESVLEVRRTTQKEIFQKYKREHTDERGKVKSNLSKEEQEGFLSLQKRKLERDIIVIKTDKSTKLAACTEEAYRQMGEEHTKKDKQISRQEVVEKEKILNSHVTAWSTIWKSGQDHGHQGRIIASKTTSSENLGDLYVMYKDHKPGDKTRPVATGNTSNSVGLSNAVSEVLEAVAKSQTRPYAAISTEDLLSKIHNYNRVVKNITESNKTLPSEPGTAAVG